MALHSARMVMALGLVVALGLGAAACSWTDNDTRSATQGLPNVQQALEAERWVLDPSESSLDPAPTSEVTLEFTGEGLSGAGPCNQYFGGYTLDDHTLTIEAVGATLRGCDEPVMAAEDAYFAALEGEHTVDVTDRDRLVLTRDGLHLEYVASDAP
jgi:heat shock protein HslJ